MRISGVLFEVTRGEVILWGEEMGVAIRIIPPGPKALIPTANNKGVVSVATGSSSDWH